MSNPDVGLMSIASFFELSGANVGAPSVTSTWPSSSTNVFLPMAFSAWATVMILRVQIASSVSRFSNSAAACSSSRQDRLLRPLRPSETARGERTSSRTSQSAGPCRLVVEALERDGAHDGHAEIINARHFRAVTHRIAAAQIDHAQVHARFGEGKEHLRDLAQRLVPLIEVGLLAADMEGD